jgi:hypothetical protein
LRAVETLDLSANDIGPAGAEALASSKSLGAIAALEMYGNHVGKRGETALRKRFGDALRL